MQWTNIKSLAEMKLVKTSYIWLLIVPVSAKFLSSVDEQISLRIFHGNFVISTALPFSWQLLFYAACFFTLGSIVYSLYCPDFLKRYVEPVDFINEGNGVNQLLENFRKLTTRDKMILDRYTDEVDTFGERFTQEPTDKYDMRVYERLKYTTNNVILANMFHFVRNFSDKYNKNALLLATALYILGLIFAAWIAVENFIYVIKVTYITVSP